MCGMARELRLVSWQGREIHFFSQGYRPTFGVHLVSCSVATGSSFSKINRPQPDADHSPPYNIEVKNKRGYTFSPPYVFVACTGMSLLTTPVFYFQPHLCFPSDLFLQIFPASCSLLFPSLFLFDRFATGCHINEQLLPAVTLLIFIRQLPGQNVGRDFEYPDMFFVFSVSAGKVFTEP